MASICHYEMTPELATSKSGHVSPIKNNNSLKYYIKEMKEYKPLIVLEQHIQSSSKHETKVIKAY